MRKFLNGLIELICWIQIFLCPSVIVGFVGFVCYKNIPGNLGVVLFIVLLAVGIAIGLYFAERTRRTVGCSTLMFRIFAIPDVHNPEHPEDMDSSDGNQTK